MTTPEPHPRWYRLTPDRFVLLLLAVEGFLLLSERFRWFSFNQHKGWTVLIAIATVGVAMLLMLLWFLARPAVPLAVPVQHSVAAGPVSCVVAIPCSWLATEMQRAKKQQEAVAAIEQAGGTVLYRCNGEEATIWNMEPREPSWLHHPCSGWISSAMQLLCSSQSWGAYNGPAFQRAHSLLHIRPQQ